MSKKYRIGSLDPRTTAEWVGVGAGVLVLGVLAYKYFSPAAAGTDAAMAANVASIKVDTTQLTKDASFYSNLSDSLYSAMNSWALDSTIDSDIIAPLQGLNTNEILLVVQDFGTRKFGLIKPFDTDKYNLRAFAQQSMDDTEYQKLNSILTAAGI